MQLYNVTWQFPEIEGQKAAYAKLIEYMAKHRDPRGDALSVLMTPICQFVDHWRECMLHRSRRANLNIVDNFGQLEY